MGTETHIKWDKRPDERLEIKENPSGDRIKMMVG